MTGGDFCDQIRSMKRIPDRENAIFDAVPRGLMVAWPMVHVDCGGNAIEVAADYLSIGELDDFVRMPMSGPLALEICALLGMRLPTAAEVLCIYKQADVKLTAMPWGQRATLDVRGRPMVGDPYGELMLGVDRLEAHSRMIDDQLAGRRGLIAGHKKDVLGVAADGRLDFVGWFRADGSEIQTEQVGHEPHEATYADYSHGVRLVLDCAQRDTWPAGPPEF